VRHVFVAVGIVLASLPAFASDLAGQASIIDGDTLEIHGARPHPAPCVLGIALVRSAVTSNLGSIAPASGRTDNRRTVRMTRAEAALSPPS
jgi:hypothetical protein